MSQNVWSINMPPNNKVRPSPPHQRRIFNNDFLREPPKENALLVDMRSVLFILKATGLMPIFESMSSNEIGPPSKANEFYSFFVRSVVHALTVFNIYSLCTRGSAQFFYTYRDTDSINQWIEVFLCILTYTTTVFICARNSQAILKIINEILKVDAEYKRQFGTSLNNNCGFSLKFTLGVCLGQFYIASLKIMSIRGPTTLTSYILHGFYIVQNGLSIVFIVFASALLRIITIRFSYLNLILDGYTYTQQRKINRRLQRVGDPATMESFPEDALFTFRMHNKLLRIYKATNEFCSLILVAYMGYAFYTITTTTYNLFVHITTQSDVSFVVLQICLVWLCIHTSMLAILSRSCGEATKEANITSQILARVYGKSKDYQNIIDKFLTKSIRQEVQFTAYGFFVIDISTLFKIFSAVTTYLVILIQFKQLEDSKNEDST